MNYNKIMVFGYSFVPQLQHFCDHFNFINLRLTEVEIDFIGNSGLHLSEIDAFEFQVRAAQPQVIAMILGENDITSNTNVLSLTSLINQAAVKLSSWGGRVQLS